MMLSKYRFLLLSCSLVLISSSMMYAYSWGRRERTLAREYLSVATRQTAISRWIVTRYQRWLCFSAASSRLRVVQKKRQGVLFLLPQKIPKTVVDLPVDGPGGIFQDMDENRLSPWISLMKCSVVLGSSSTALRRTISAAAAGTLGKLLDKSSRYFRSVCFILLDLLFLRLQVPGGGDSRHIPLPGGLGGLIRLAGTVSSGKHPRDIGRHIPAPPPRAPVHG